VASLLGASLFPLALLAPYLDDLFPLQMEETGSQVTICIDLDEHRITSFIALSYGHFNEADKAKGWKREKMEQWKELAKIKPEPESRELLPETAKIEKVRICDRRSLLSPLPIPFSRPLVLFPSHLLCPFSFLRVPLPVLSHFAASTF
jgi:hypothetical protein